MKLRIWLWKNKFTIKAFAEKINYSESYMRNILRGICCPSIRAAKAISDGTNREVSVEDILEYFREK